jgi:hypothetical protein
MTTRGKLAVVILAIAAFAGVKHLRSPLRIPLPAESVAIAAVRPQLDRLEPRERELVMGYLLRKRREVPSTFMRDDPPFDAYTFGDAITAQELFLKREGFYAPAAFLKIGVRDQLMHPLREVAVGELAGRTTTSRREIYGIPAGASTRYGNDPVAEEDKPILVTIYRVRNLTDQAIAKVTGTVEIRRARYDQSMSLGLLNSCYFTVEDLPANGSRDVSCSNLNRFLTIEDQEFLKTAEGDMHIVWSPSRVEFADGRVLEFREQEVKSTQLWGIYKID